MCILLVIVLVLLTPLSYSDQYEKKIEKLKEIAKQTNKRQIFGAQDYNNCNLSELNEGDAIIIYDSQEAKMIKPNFSINYSCVPIYRPAPQVPLGMSENLPEEAVTWGMSDVKKASYMRERIKEKHENRRREWGKILNRSSLTSPTTHSTCGPFTVTRSEPLDTKEKQVENDINCD